MTENTAGGGEIGRRSLIAGPARRQADIIGPQGFSFGSQEIAQLRLQHHPTRMQDTPEPRRGK